MNFQNVLNTIAETDPEVYERTSERRHVLKSIGRVATLAAVPLALGSLFKKAYGQSTSSIVEALNFALLLECLEAEFYKEALANFSNFIGATPAAQAAITTIKTHEVAHVSFLTDIINRMAGAGSAQVKDASDFDFTAGGAFGNVFTDYATFLAVAQVFEDTGVRAYKGQAANLMSNNDVLTAALQIHSVEARHASHIRQMRKTSGGALLTGTIKPWITLNQSNINNSAVQASYNGENLTDQGVPPAVFSLLNIGGNTAIDAEAASESFDEPLDKAAVTAIVTPFLVP